MSLKHATLAEQHMCMHGLSCACRKRETLTGDATIRYFDYLEGFDSFDGLLANLFTGDLRAWQFCSVSCPALWVQHACSRAAQVGAQSSFLLHPPPAVAAAFKPTLLCASGWQVPHAATVGRT